MNPKDRTPNGTGTGSKSGSRGKASTGSKRGSQARGAAAPERESQAQASAGTNTGSDNGTRAGSASRKSAGSTSRKSAGAAAASRKPGGKATGGAPTRNRHEWTGDPDRTLLEIREEPAVSYGPRQQDVPHFDTREAIRILEDGGVPGEQADVHVEVLDKTLRTALEPLATKADLKATETRLTTDLRDTEARLIAHADKKAGEAMAHADKKAGEAMAHTDKKAGEVKSELKGDIAEVKSDIAELKTDIAGMREQINGLNTKLDLFMVNMAAAQQRTDEKFEEERRRREQFRDRMEWVFRTILIIAGLIIAAAVGGLFNGGSGGQDQPPVEIRGEPAAPADPAPSPG